MKQYANQNFQTISNMSALEARANRRLGSDDAGTRVESTHFEDCFECLSPLRIPA